MRPLWWMITTAVSTVATLAAAHAASTDGALAAPAQHTTMLTRQLLWTPAPGAASFNTSSIAASTYAPKCRRHEITQAPTTAAVAAAMAEATPPVLSQPVNWHHRPRRARATTPAWDPSTSIEGHYADRPATAVEDVEVVTTPTEAPVAALRAMATPLEEPTVDEEVEERASSSEYESTEPVPTRTPDVDGVAVASHAEAQVERMETAVTAKPDATLAALAPTPWSTLIAEPRVVATSASPEPVQALPSESLPVPQLVGSVLEEAPAATREEENNGLGHLLPVGVPDGNTVERVSGLSQGGFASVIADTTSAAAAAAEAARSIASLPPDLALCLTTQNAARAFEGAWAMAWNASLAETACGWSETQARKRLMHHSTLGYGENLYSTSRGGDTSCSVAVAAWVAEKVFYASGMPVGGDGVHDYGHFTQVVWPGTKQVGCCSATADDGATYWTCEYHPAGNVLGQPAY